MLGNEKYIGDALLQKTITTDFLNKKRVANKGIVPQYYVENSQELSNSWEKTRGLTISCSFRNLYLAATEIKMKRDCQLHSIPLLAFSSVSC